MKTELAMSNAGPSAKAVLAAAAVLTLALPAAAQEAASTQPGLETGTFQKLTGPIGKMLKLARAGKGLRLDRPYWEKDFEDKSRKEVLKMLQDELNANRRGSSEWAESRARQMLERYMPADLAFERFRASLQHSGSSSSWSSSHMSKSFSGGDLSGHMELRGRLVKIVLQESGSWQRKLEITDDGWGSLGIVLSDAAGRLALVINQGGSGRFNLVHVADEEVFAESAPSFEDFYRAHRSYVEDRLFPLLAHTGIIVPLTRHNARVRQAVLARVAPGGEAQLARGSSLLQQLNDGSASIRQRAGEELSANFARYRDLIEEALKDRLNPPELAARLKRIIAENADADEVEKFLADQGLAEDVGYLVELLAQAEPADRAAIAKALRRLTRQDLGPDAAAWKKWWSQRNPAGRAADKAE